MLDQETRTCLSVAGGKTLEMKEEQAERMVLTEKIKTDLELFCKMAKEQKDHLQTAKVTWKQLQEVRARFRPKQQGFQREMKEFADILDESVTAEMETPILIPLLGSFHTCRIMHFQTAFNAL
uniref:Uncharacterized protein n=1 Tax=Sphaerodactylus townsendi TaxID=933632 RepID=A0ACB8EPN3_9SAUR